MSERAVKYKHEYKHVHRIKKRLANGEIRIYYRHRLSGKRIHGEPGSDEFLASYAEAAAAAQRNQEETIEKLVEEYKRSPAYSNLAAITRDEYDRFLVMILSEFEGAPLAALDDKRIRGDFLRLRDRIAETSLRRADFFWSVARRLVGWGVQYSRINYNHLTRPGKLYKTTRADKRWDLERVRAFMTTANPALRRAMVLALHTGQRQGDLRAAIWSAYDGDALKVTQSKTGARVVIPCSGTLRSCLDQWERPGLCILTSPTGLPWKRDNLNSQWRKAARAAEITDLTFNDLRGTFITALSEAGATPQEIASISGHALEGKQKILDTYSARTLKQARAAVAKLEQTWIAGVTDAPVLLEEKRNETVNQTVNRKPATGRRS